MQWQVESRGSQVPVLIDEEQSPIVVILAHGAGSHMEQKTMVWLSDIVRGTGCQVVRFNFLYRALGKGMPDRMPGHEVLRPADLEGEARGAVRASFQRGIW